MPRENVGSRLGADPERITKSAGDRQRNSRTLAFEQGVGRDRRAHPHPGEFSTFPGQDARYSFKRGVSVITRIVRQQFHHPPPPIAVARDDVGERPTAIDRKGPAGVHQGYQAEWRGPLNRL